MDGKLKPGISGDAQKHLGTFRQVVLELTSAWTGTGMAATQSFKLLVTALLVFDLIMTTQILLYFPRTDADTEDVCAPKVLNPRRIDYHNDQNFYSALKILKPPSQPVFRGEKMRLCDADAWVAAQYEYCLPITGRKDTPFCTAADRMDLLNLRSSKSICFASVLHMLMVEVYEELQATGNIPFLTFGSLLGAVRNGSMIPFTEDVDIGYVGEMIAADDLRFALRKKGYHMFFMGIWRVCVAPTHPLAGHLYDPNLPISTSFSVPYVDLYKMQQKDNGDWDLEELEGSNGRILPAKKVMPFSQATINGMPFETVADPKFFLTEAYGDDFMTPRPRENEPSAASQRTLNIRGSIILSG